MKLKSLLIAVATLAGTFNGIAQEKEAFKASGSPTFKLFSNYHSTFTDGKTFNQFELTRAYLGYKHNFSENWSGGVIFDVGNPGSGKHEMAAYVKNAYLKYNKNGWTVNFGLISTTAFKTSEKFWGNRYLYKSFQDEYKFGASADLGISAAYKFNKMVSADVILVNGEGYKKIEADSIMSIGVGLTLKPIDGLMIRGYYETYTNDAFMEVEVEEEQTEMIKKEGQNTMSLFLGYTLKDFSIAAEYNEQKNYKGFKDADWEGYSVFSAYKLKSSKLFARYDMLTSNDGFNASKDRSTIILGAEFSPVKGVKITPNYRNISFEKSGKESINQIYVSCEIKF